MGQSKRLLLITALLSLFVTTPAYSDTTSLSVGFNGIAFEYTRPFSERLNIRVALTDMPFEMDIEEDDIDYEVEWDRTNLGFLIDYRPLSGAFHLTTGLYFGDNKWEMSAKSSGIDEFEIGDGVYYADNLGLDASVEFAKTAPYFGLGWGNAAEGSGFTANVDLGLLLIGKASVSYDSSGTICTDATCTVEIAVGSDAAFQADIEKERADLEEDLEDFEWLPVIQFGMGYRF